MLTLGSVELLTSTAAGRWNSVLDRVEHDIYHTPAYHRLSGFGQAGAPRAFVYQEEDNAFVWPYLLTPIDEAPGYHDVTSVYGYPGPVGTKDPDFTGRAWEALTEHWKEERVVAAFTRFNPLLGNDRLLAGVPAAAAGVKDRGNTVAIDLTLPVETQFQQYHKNLRYAIRKARETGLQTFEDTRWAHVDDFVAVYQDTMARCGSRPEYVVDREWIHNFRDAMGTQARLFVTTQDQSVAAAMIVIDYGSNLHCHLIGSAPEFAAISPSKVLLDDVRRWGTENGRRTMHLGGGLGGREDALYQFKRKFSSLTQCFRTGNWILNAPVYRELEEANRATQAARGLEIEHISYFPSYRFNPAV